MITTRKRHNKRFFSENGKQIALYKLEKDDIRLACASIYKSDGDLKGGSDSLGIYLLDYETHSNRQILSFLKKYFKTELAKAILEHLYDDLRLISYSELKVTFT